jgi:cold shock CspA family protein
VVGVASGQIIRFSASKGYGFIEQAGGEDVFVHAEELGGYATSVRPGTWVEFNILESSRGLKACDVTVIDQTREPVQPPAASISGDRLPPTPSANQEADDDYLSEAIPRAEYAREITDTLIEVASDITAGQINTIRQRLVDAADQRGWLDD